MSQKTVGREEDLVARLADWIARQGLVTPAMFMLEAGKPFSFLGGQVLWMLQPLLGPVMGYDRISSYARLLEDSASVDRLLTCLESRQVVGDDPVSTDDTVL
jgi:hypothetical protein